MPDYTRPAGMDRGIRLTAIDALAAVGTGTNKSQVFAAPPTPLADGQLTLQYQSIPNGSMTAFTVDLEVSADFGTTWTKVGNTIDMVAVPAGNLTVTSGMLYRLNVKTFTLNAATVASVYVSA